MTITITFALAGIVAAIAASSVYGKSKMDEHADHRQDLKIMSIEAAMLAVVCFVLSGIGWYNLP